MDPEELADSSLALVMIASAEDDGDDEDWGMYIGVIREADIGLVFIYGEGERLALRESWLDAIEPVTDEISDILQGADYVLRARVPYLPDA